VSVYTEFAKTIKVKSTAIYICHNKVKILKYHLTLYYSKLVTILKV